MSMPGNDLSQPARRTEPSSRSANITVSTESAMTSRDTSEARMPSWPIEMPSETEMEPNSSGKPPAARTPSLARLASRSRERLHGVISFQDEATPICGLSQSSSPMPTARSMARAGALAIPSVTSRLRGLRSAVWLPVGRSSTVVTSGDGRPVGKTDDERRLGPWVLVAVPARLRMTRAALLPVVLLLLCVIPLAAASPWALLVLLLPLLAAAWVLRVGVDVDDAGITARKIVGTRTVPWSGLAGIRVGRRGNLWLVTTRSTEVALPVLRARDRPRGAELSGGRIPGIGPAAAEGPRPPHSSQARGEPRAGA